MKIATRLFTCVLVATLMLAALPAETMQAAAAKVKIT